MGRVVTWKHVVIVVIGVLLVARVASELTGRGAPYWHYDLRMLYREQSTFYAGVYPHADVAQTPPGRLPVRSDYPPYSLLLFVPLLPPRLGFGGTAIWFTVCQLATLVTVAAGAWRYGQAGGHSLAVLLAGSLLVITGLRADLLFGNIALITTALLTGVLWSTERNRWWTAAVFWAAAMIKPQMGWLFAMLFFNEKAWKPWVTAVGGLGGLALLACGWDQVSPFRALGIGTARSWSDIVTVGERYSLVTLLIAAGVPAAIALIGCALLGLGAVAWRFRTTLVASTVLQRFAFIALVNRICTYHNVCDDLLLAFPLLWLGLQAGETNRTSDWVAFCILGLSVWAPTAMFGTYTAKILVIVVWVILAAWVSMRRGCPALAAEAGRGTGCR